MAQSYLRVCSISLHHGYFNYCLFPWSFHHFMDLVFSHYVLCYQLDSVPQGSFVFACHIGFHSCLFVFRGDVFMASLRSTPTSFLFTCADYWSLVSVYIIFYHRWFSLPHSGSFFFLPCCKQDTYYTTFTFTFPFVTLFVLLLQSPSTVVFFCQSFLSDGGKDKCKCTSAVTKNF